MSLDYNTACNAYENEDYKRAFELFFNLAKEGDVSSQMNIANMLLHGIGVEKNPEMAYECYEQAAQNSDSEAQYIYGWHCLEEKKTQEGLRYLHLASDADYSEAIYDLAGIYSQGLYSCETDMAKAVELYEKSVRLGNREALSGLLYAKIKSGGRAKAIMYFLKNIIAFARVIRA